MSDPIKRCPFCRSQKLRPVYDDDECYIECLKCSSTGPYAATEQVAYNVFCVPAALREERAKVWEEAAEEMESYWNYNGFVKLFKAKAAAERAKGE